MITIIKRQAKKTYKNKDGKERHFYNYYVQLENGKRVQVKCAFDDDYRVLDAIAKYER